MAGAPNFANRTMWTRDNLDVLRGLNSESIDLVYGAPPFNSNKNYEALISSKAAGAAFKDTQRLGTGEIADREPKVYAAIDNAGIVHGPDMKSYLIMTAVRLLELRRVLKPSGALVLHCDPTADAYLQMTQFRIASADGSNSRASSPGVRPDRTSSTICCRNAAGYGGLDFGIVDSSSSPRG